VRRVDQRRRDLDPIQFLHLSLNITGRHASCVEGQNFVLKARQTGLLFLNQLGLKASFSVTRNGNFYLSLLALQLFSAGAIATISGCRFWALSVFGIAQVHFQLGFQATLDQSFRQLLDQPIAAQNFTGITAFLQEFVDEFGSDRHFHPFLLLPLPLVVPAK
jgi:hypothetical protein